MSQPTSDLATPRNPLLGAIQVTTTADSGAGSLRAAILAANGTPALDVIQFAIPGSGIKTISPATPLPGLTTAITIDGTTQSGYAGSPVIELDGTSAGSGSWCCSLALAPVPTCSSAAPPGTVPCSANPPAATATW